MTEGRYNQHFHMTQQPSYPAWKASAATSSEAIRSLFPALLGFPGFPGFPNMDIHSRIWRTATSTGTPQLPRLRPCPLPLPACLRLPMSPCLCAVGP